MIKELRRDCSGDLFSYTYLMDHLQHYANPRGKIGRLLESGDIVRIKKGLYVFGKDYRMAPIDRGVLANLIYGPSYVSGLWALSQYGLIPERVEVVTSMTTQKGRQFTTPFGTFEYLYLNPRRYTVGVDWRAAGERQHSLFASLEKALADVVARETDLTSHSKMLEFLVENLRMDQASFKKFDLGRLARITAAYSSPAVRRLQEVIAHG